MKKLFCFLAAFVFAGCFISKPAHQKNANPQSIRFEEYFPLIENAVHIYHMQFDGVAGGRKIDEDDSCIFKTYRVNGTDVFYIDRHSDERETIIGSNAFCAGVFYFDKGRFMYNPAFWRKDLEETTLTDYHVLFPETTLLNTIYETIEGKKTTQYKFTGFETITVNGKMYENCLKLEMTENWPERKYSGTAWFMKNVGLVKWIRYTGRIEELKE